MNILKMKYFKSSVLLMAGLATGLAALAMPNVGGKSAGTGEKRSSHLKGTDADCVPTTAKIDLDINNVRARLMTGGDMWWDPGVGEARYEIPKGSRKSSLFAGSLWVGGYDAQKNLKVAAQTYRQTGNDYWPGPITVSNSGTSTNKAQCSDWDQFWKVNNSDILEFQSLFASGLPATDPKFDVINQWPAKGNRQTRGVGGGYILDGSTQHYAPFIDVDGDDVYDASKGDYPDIKGDQYIWWVYNDIGNTKLETGSDQIGLEVQASAFAFSTNDFLNDATFYNYKLINRGATSLDSTYVATWTDADLGNAFDDYIGCDTARSLGILYNGKTVDGNGEINSYGSQIPMVGVDFFIGPKSYNPIKMKYDTLGMAVFTYYNNVQTGALRNPQGVHDYYNYMSGTNAGNQHIRNDYQGPGVPSSGFGNGPLANAVFPGDPSNPAEWSECQSGNQPYDRRFIHSAGPFRLESGGVSNDITIGVVWVPNVGGCPSSSFQKIKIADIAAQELFDNNFKNLKGPQAPRLAVRELDRKLVFYLTNEGNYVTNSGHVSANTPVSYTFKSNNAREQYGTTDSTFYHESNAKTRRSNDSLYKFEGYRVFQLKNPTVTVSQIYNADGTVNSDVAAEVFQTDVKNGVKGAVNYTRADNSTIGYNSVPRIINSKDSGIQHSFVLTTDNFATGIDKQFVNYKNYYFVAVAYAYNRFKAFNPAKADSTQDLEYLEGSASAGGRPIFIVDAMPNPANGNIGTSLNTDFGAGVAITRVEGIGNGHIALQMDQASEDQALATNQSLHPTYLQGHGPVDIKVIDPLKITGHKYELYITGTLPLVPGGRDTAKGLLDTSASWKLVADNGQVINSERRLNAINEQILEGYGLSISVRQVARPGDNQPSGNGYISSSVEFADQAQAWLAGVNDGESHEYTNWIRSGKFSDPKPPTAPAQPCDWDDFDGDTLQVYENMFPQSTPLKNTWAPYNLAAFLNKASCGFGVSLNKSGGGGLQQLYSVDVVMTPDKSKWTKCVVVEMEDDASLAEHNVSKFNLRSHRSWTGNVANGQPEYSTNPNDTGMSYFPGYAINQETGERLNIIFGEDSWLKNNNGTDLIWNPTGTILDDDGHVIFGGKHYVYVQRSKYDEGQTNRIVIADGGNPREVFDSVMWVGLPTIAPGFHLRSLEDGLIPTVTRLKFRVDRPYTAYNPDPSLVLKNAGFPLYTFSTERLVPTGLNDAGNTRDKQNILDSIMAVPNPYYGYSGYELNRLDTRVRIVNLPNRATISIYSLDGTLVRRVEKSDPNFSYVDWDLRNAKGLPVGSGMYLMHVNAEGVGETIIRWFGSMRPLDITTF